MVHNFNFWGNSSKKDILKCIFKTLFNIENNIFPMGIFCSPFTDNYKLSDNKLLNERLKKQNFKFIYINNENEDFDDKKSEKGYKDKLGSSTWTLLHAISFNYPEIPNMDDKKHIREFIKLLAILYPCKDCQLHFKKYLNENKIHLESRRDFIKWVCNFHNHVNQRLGKNIFNCKLL
ncbi:hypothetical protein EDEG_00727 [Edhazardia aedis USNM 41457]|uniref:Sulfhydryl oxidase n=1 Tax=Edhazardia aedis (strain USNM 41457) TaxID=1003232 RepID=J9DRK3_EDHAE|nr:hypothetical protein EDEG_00727 [Edhazardia aedis USNM 41457]|eukprot:EJW05195.1 hypothetical protein EDEG_00727 [Edhazardia aedis USNM 41457]